MTSPHGSLAGQEDYGNNKRQIERTETMKQPGSVVLGIIAWIASVLVCNVQGADGEARPQTGERVTTTPVTQNRDSGTYNWQKRHAEILERNKEIKPDVVIIGDSIVHYWGGEPQAPLTRGAPAWSNCFDGISVENLGFGWDRVENVLWRIEHGELDGIDPKVIVIKIGTNNLRLNSPEDIAAGIEAVCAAAHEKQPGAKILLLGILTRRDETPGDSATDRVNKLLAAHVSGVAYVTFRDVGPAFRNADGTPNAALFGDKVHPNAAGYEILGQKIRPEVQALLKRGT